MLTRSRTLPSRIAHGSSGDESRESKHHVKVDVEPKRHELAPVTGAAATAAAAAPLSVAFSKCIDDDGRPKRTGTVWTASSHIITAVIGSGVLSLAWAMAQLGWAAGPVIMILFALVILYTSNLLSACYRTGDPVSGKRNYSYMDAVRSNLGGTKVNLCGFNQYINLFGVAIGYTIAASISMNNGYMITFGLIEVVFSQIPNFDQIWWLSIVAAVMSFTYSTVGLSLAAAQVSENGHIRGSAMGISIGKVTGAQKVWRSLQALGDIAFAYSYSIILIEIQDTVKSPPVEHQTMKKATVISVVVTTVFYMLCGCMGYAAFGDDSPGNLLTGAGFSEPYWLLDIANLAIVIHLIGAYQVYCQPLFAFVEKWSAQRWPKISLITNGRNICLPLFGSYNFNLFRLVWRTAFVVLTTVISMLMPFFNDVVGILGAIGFWPLTVYFPIEMYINQKKISKWSNRWFGLQILSFACLLVSVAAACGSIAGVFLDLKSYKPFKSSD